MVLVGMVNDGLDELARLGLGRWLGAWVWALGRGLVHASEISTLDSSAREGRLMRA